VLNEGKVGEALSEMSTGLNGSGEDIERGRRKHTHRYCEICGAEGTDYQGHCLPECDAVYCSSGM